MPKTIFDDKRPIQSVCTAGEDYSVWMVGRRTGRHEVEKIVPYKEGELTWLAVYSDDDIVARVNCAAIESITYK